MEIGGHGEERFSSIVNVRDTGTEKIRDTDFPFRQFIIHHERSVRSPPVSEHIVESQSGDDVINLAITQIIIGTPKLVGRKISPFHITLSEDSKLALEKSSLYTADIFVIIVLVVGIRQTGVPSLGQKINSESRFFPSGLA